MWFYNRKNVTHALPLTWFDLDFTRLKPPVWTRIFTSAQFYLLVPLSLAATSQLMPLQRRRKEKKLDALMLKLCAVAFLNNLQWQGQLTVDTEGLVLTPPPKTSDTSNHSLTPCCCFSGTELRGWREICCLRETGYYLNREEAIGDVWGRGMRLRSAVCLQQLSS